MRAPGRDLPFGEQIGGKFTQEQRRIWNLRGHATGSIGNSEDWANLGKRALRLQFPVGSLNVTGNVTKGLGGVNVITCPNSAISLVYNQF